MRRFGRSTAALAACVAVLALGGCAQAPKPLYHWGGYPQQMYAGLKDHGGDPAAQLAQLQQIADKAQASAAALPPGFRAHMGMVQLRLGRDGEALLLFEAEKTAFPESASYMNFLLTRMKVAKP